MDRSGGTRYYDSEQPLPRSAVEQTMAAVRAHTQALIAAALTGLRDINGLRLYGPTNPYARTALAAFNIRGLNPFQIAEEFGASGVEARAGCHCATLAHRDLGLDPPASCRLSFAVYNTLDDVTTALTALQRVIRSSRGVRCS